MRLMQWAKGGGIPIFIVGHVTKEGDIAGPRVLEHIVDVVLYLEGERFSSYRLLRGVKNRFGSTNEVGVFEMTAQGLAEVENPSEVFLAERGEGAVGSVVVPTLEGSRPLLVEVQALTSPTVLAVPRRTANGLDFNRLLLITAVLAKRAGLALANQDVIANVVGGLRVAGAGGRPGPGPGHRLQQPRRGPPQRPGGHRRGGPLGRAALGGPAGASPGRGRAPGFPALPPAAGGPASRHSGHGPGADARCHLARGDTPGLRLGPARRCPSRPPPFALAIPGASQ